MNEPRLIVRLSCWQVVYEGLVITSSRRWVELYALLAVKLIRSEDTGQVGLDEINRLPSWRGNKPESLGKQVRRHIAAHAERGVSLIACLQKTYGPFWLSLSPEEVEIDADLDEVDSLLGRLPTAGSLDPSKREAFFRFVYEVRRGSKAMNDGRLRAALAHYQRAKDNAHLASQKLAALCNIARMQERLGLFEQAAASHQQAEMVLSDRLGEWDFWQIRLLTIKAFLAYRQQDFDKAENLYRQAAVALSRGRADYGLSAEISNGTGLILKARGQEHEALIFFFQALEAWSLAENFYGVQSAYFNIGVSFSKAADRAWAAGQRTQAQDDYEVAAAWLNQCIALCAEMEIADDLSDDRILLSHVVLRLGRVDEAIELARQANTNASRAENTRCIAQSFNALVNAALAKGDRAQAREAAESCLDQLGQECLQFIDETSPIRALAEKRAKAGFRPADEN